MNTFDMIVIFVIGAICGGLINLALAVIFENPARRLYGRLRRSWWWIRSRVGKERHHHARELFQVGHWSVNCVVVEGDPVRPMSPSDITCKLDPVELKLPPELAALRKKVFERQNRIAGERGVSEYFNGPMVALSGFHRSRKPGSEDPILQLSCKTTDYYTFLATSGNIDKSIDGETETTIRHKYLRSARYDEPISVLATSLGVNIAVVTRDGYLMIVKRGVEGVANYRGYWAVPICESVNPYLDRNEAGQLSLVKTALRGASEESGFLPSNPDILFFSLCVDITWYLYGFTGLIKENEITSDYLMSLRSRGVKDKWESTSLERVRFDPDAVVRFISDTGGVSVWHPASFAAIVQTLVHEFGDSAVEKAFIKLG